MANIKSLIAMKKNTNDQLIRLIRIYKSIYCQKKFKNNCTLSQFTFTQEAQFPNMVLLSSESYNIISSYNSILFQTI